MVYASTLELYMLELINEERSSRNLDLLELETNLNQSAEDHSNWMLQTDIFSHTGVDGSSATQRIRAAGFDLAGSWGTAENIAVQSARGAQGYLDDVADLHTSLMNSEGHRKNLLNPDLEYIGIGIEIGSFQYSSRITANSVIVTQNFGRTGGSVDLDDLEGGKRAAATADTGTQNGGDNSTAIVASEHLNGNSANEILNGGDNADTIWAGNGNDTVTGGNGDDVLGGMAGSDKIWAGSGDDTVYAGAGNDILGAGDGDDVVWGHDGQDTIYGDSGHDTLYGGNGDDRIWAGVGNDVLYGDAGDDVLGGMDGFDKIWAGSGNDTIYAGGWSDTVGGGDGNDVIWGGNGNDLVWGGEGHDKIDGGLHNDTLNGDSGDDLVRGGDGNDSVTGGWGRDTLEGGAGDDALDGGYGNDRLTGGAGNDTFVFAAEGGQDVITDFGSGDILLLDNGLWSASHGWLSTQQIVSTFGSVADGNTTLEFDGGEVLVLTGVSDLTGIELF
jgi:Ca2+-binding RTX toxin-like protein